MCCLLVRTVHFVTAIAVVEHEQTTVAMNEGIEKIEKAEWVTGTEIE